ncbi:hypothetical protein [Streptosporangium sp. NPDC002524]|uniref:hypothetical protein n=1 Tax=Streptosporangium sp. NPDC002524 TaxID=3154537 RepID=UPI0033222E9D
MGRMREWWRRRVMTSMLPPIGVPVGRMREWWGRRSATSKLLITGVATVLIAAPFVGVLEDLGRRVFLPDSGAPTPSARVPTHLPTSTPKTDDEMSKRPIYSYHAKASSANEDIDVKIESRGFVRQVFVAAALRIRSVGVIASREMRPGADFSLDNLGPVGLRIDEVDAKDRVVAAVPLAEADGGAAPSTSGIVIYAGPNHKDTVFRLAPVKVKPGARYAFTVTNLSGGVMSFSLRPRGLPGLPMYMWGYQPDPHVLQSRTNRAVTGFVCDLHDGCS